MRGLTRARWQDLVRCILIELKECMIMQYIEFVHNYDIKSLY